MARKNIGANTFIPMPMALLGTTVQGKANFMALGWVMRANANPPMIAVGVFKPHYTVTRIAESQTFSVNFPSAEMVQVTDYCGLVSGDKIDKSELFEVFYGDVQTAPMIAQCPLCLECKLVQTVELPSNMLFIGEITSSYAEERYLTDGKPDIKKMNLFVLTMPDNQYWSIGESIGNAWKIGKDFKKD